MYVKENFNVWPNGVAIVDMVEIQWNGGRSQLRRGACEWQSL
jgi:hypothetical protein